MSTVQVVSQTQTLTVTTETQHLNIDQATSEVTFVVSDATAVAVTNAGPPGPPGSLGSFDMVPVLEEIDTRIAIHDQGTPIHTNATSGRDFVALFQNGLI